MRGHRETRGPVLEAIAVALKAALVAIATPTPGFVPTELGVTVERDVFECCLRECSLHDRIVHDYDAHTEEILIDIERDHRRLIVRCVPPPGRKV